VLTDSPSRTAIQQVLQRIGQLTETHAQEVETALEKQAPLDTQADYADYRQQGLPISSGPIEAACKTLVGHRPKRAGMRWTESGGQHILNLRASLLSQRRDALWNWYLQHTDHQQLLSAKAA